MTRAAAGGMRARTTRSRRPPVLADARVRRWAVVSGWTGVVANALLIVFFSLSEPFSAQPNGLAWTGTVNDWLVAVQFAALLPVVAAVGRRLPATRGLRVLTAAALLATGGTVALQLLLVL